MRKIILGTVIGILSTLLIQHGIHYLKWRPYRQNDQVMHWAYLHVPTAIAQHSAHTLQAELETSGGYDANKSYDILIVYSNEGKIKAIRTSCFFKDGRMTTPTDSDLRNLDASAPYIPIPIK